MARLPVIGQDEDSWGGILNEFLQVGHYEDGTLKSGLGAYSAIVYIDGSSVIARDYKGDLIASGTAGTDDYSVLQAAINNQSGLIKVISDLTLTNKVEPASNIILDFRGQTIKSAFTNAIIQKTTTGNDITIIGGIFDSQNSYATPIAFYNITNLRIIDVEVKDVNVTDGGYGIYIEDCDYVWIINPKISNITSRDGLQFKGVHNGWIINPYVNSASIYGIDCHASTTPRYCEDIYIVNPKVYNSQNGIHLADTSFHLINPRITGSSANGLTIDGDGTVVYIISPYIYNSGQNGINTYDATSISFLQVIGGEIDTTGADKDGMYLKNITKTKIENIFIHNAGRYGVNVQSDNIDISFAEIKDCGNHGIFIGGKSHTRIINNVIKNNGGYGILEYTGSDNNVIELNEFSGNTSGAVSKVGSNTKVQNNIGYVTENESSATITNGNTSVTVNHGLVDTPTNIQLTGTHSEVKDAYVTNPGATSFDITVDAAVTEDRTVYWKAKV